MQLNYRMCNIKDLEKIVDIARITFDDTFRASNTEENMNAYMDSSFSKNKLTEELKNEESEFYFAYLNDSLIGYFKINTGRAQTEDFDNSYLELERFYLLKEFKGQNFGKQILEKVVNLARGKNVKYIWLGVWEKNYRALKFYGKNGFTKFGEHFFIMGRDKQVDHLMKLSL
ncbi:MAG: GNAT family N-acetyltransferase [Bacteroidales bacterium]|nr:MAG: GNAT family N-acetyltransferase [Bacteroidales bacterium]